MMPTQTRTWLETVQACLDNRLPLEAPTSRWLCGIIGDRPSTFARSPTLWNAAFKALEWPAQYVAFDVSAPRLSELVEALRHGERFLGGSVTMPYKAAVLPLLDEVDPLAEQIGAVNTIVRTPNGRLIGYNTDGLGGLKALTEPVLEGHPPLVAEVASLHVVLVGSGGAAQALACTLARAMGASGRLTIIGRTPSRVEALAQRTAAASAARVATADESTLTELAATVDVLINATTKGQSGIRRVADGWTCLEPYAAPAPARPAAIAMEPLEEARFWPEWSRASRADVEANHAASWEVIGRLPRSAICYDIIYSPAETVFLQQARWSGRRTRNGKGMNLAQALEAFCTYVCRGLVEASGEHPSAMRRRIAQAMIQA